MREWYHRLITERHRLPLLLSFVAFVVTFVVTRLITRLIHAGRGPFKDNVSASGTHIHHAVPGTVLLVVGAFMAVGTSQRPYLEIAAVLVGAAVGPWAARLPLELRAWMLAYPAYLALVLDVGTSLVRYAVPLFPLALVLVGGGMRRIPRGWPVLAAVLVALSLWGQYAWTTELLVLDPPSDYPP